MDSFFSRYPSFNYQPQEPPLSEFLRLQASKPKWNQRPAAKAYRRARRNFILTWNKRNGAGSVDPIWEFFSQFPEFNYNPGRQGVDPDTEFERLAALREWKVEGREYRNMKAQFQRALGSGRTELVKVGSDLPRENDPIRMFFANFQGFDYNPTQEGASPASEFQRLAVLRGWRAEGKKYNKWRKEFEAAIRSTHNPSPKDPVNLFFAQFPDFQYDPAKEQATPRTEFERLVALKVSGVGTRQVKLRQLEAQFQHAEACLERDDGADPLSFYFAEWPAFQHIPIVDVRSANIEFERLRIFTRWGKRKECQRRTEFQNALKFLYGEDAVQAESMSLDYATLEPVGEQSGGVRLIQSDVPGAPSGSSLERAVVTTSGSRHPLDEFFARYPDFNYNPAAPYRSEFQRLCAHRAWKPGKRRFRKARTAFAVATGEELLWYLQRDGSGLSALRGPGQGVSGGDEQNPGAQGDEDLDSKPWRRLCEILKLTTADGEPPKSKSQCKKVMRGVFINIHDFVDHLRDGIALKRFPTLRALAAYTYAEGGVYPKLAAKRNELLRFLLQQINSGRNESDCSDTESFVMV